MKTAANNSGTGSVANGGGNASYSDSSAMYAPVASAGTGTASTANVFGGAAVVSSATLASYVTGVRVLYTAPSGSNAQVNNSLTTGAGAFQNFAGTQSLNMNTGAGASQNSAVNVSVSAGTISLTR